MSFTFIFLTIYQLILFEKYFLQLISRTVSIYFPILNILIIKKHKIIILISLYLKVLIIFIT